MRYVVVVLGLLAGLLYPHPAFAQDTKPKNVVLIIADDLGLDLGCYGNTAIKMPNLDGLAKKGVRFANAYSSVSSCSPGRASIYTGLFTHQNGQYGLQHATHKQETYAWVKSLPALLRAAGYWTGTAPWDDLGSARAFARGLRLSLAGTHGFVAVRVINLTHVTRW